MINLSHPRYNELPNFETADGLKVCHNCSTRYSPILEHCPQCKTPTNPKSKNSERMMRNRTISIQSIFIRKDELNALPKEKRKEILSKVVIVDECENDEDIEDEDSEDTESRACARL